MATLVKSLMNSGSRWIRNAPSSGRETRIGLALGGATRAAAKDKLSFTFNAEPAHEAAVWAIQSHASRLRVRFRVGVASTSRAASSASAASAVACGRRAAPPVGGSTLA